MTTSAPPPGRGKGPANAEPRPTSERPERAGPRPTSERPENAGPRPTLKGPSSHPGGPPLPALVLQHVHARDTAGPGGRARGAITDLSLALGHGIHAIVGAPEDGTLALLDVVTGRTPPLRGKISIDGRDPGVTPLLRARVGVLAAEPHLPPAPSVGASIRLALRARGEVGHRFDAVLDPLGLSALHARKVRSLSFAEARAVELALALTTPAPLMVALHEPLGDVALQNLYLVQRRLRELAAARVCVLFTTSSPSDALALADRVFVLHKGFLVREVGGEGRGLGQGASVELTAWIAAPSAAAERDDRIAVGRGAARALAGALSRAPGVRGVSWEEAHPGASLVRVRGDTAEACADALIEATVATGVAIEAIASGAPSLPEVRATTDALLRARSSFSARATPLPVPPHGASRDARSATSSLPAPPPRSPVEDGGPLGRPKSVPAPRGEDESESARAVPFLPAPPALPNIPGARVTGSLSDRPSSSGAPLSSTVDKGER